MPKPSLPPLRIEKASKHPKHMVNTRLLYSVINVLPQPRKTFKGIDKLGNSVAAKNIRQELQVGRFDSKHCQRYLNEINELWGTNFRLEELIYVMERGVKVFYILLDGERRYRSCIYLIDIGCNKCRKKYKTGCCYSRHFGDLKVDARISENISPDDALEIQMQTNIHHRVPPYEEAEFYDRLFKLRKTRDTHYTPTEFADDMGVSTEKIKQAIRFCELPLELQEYVVSRKIPWGIGLLIVSLRERTQKKNPEGQIIDVGLTDKELEWWIIRSITNEYKVSEFKELVENFLRIRESGQASLLDIFSDEQRKELKKRSIRMVVEKRAIRGLWGFIHYFEKVYSLYQDGKLGKEDSPFSIKSPIRVFRTMIDREKKLLPCLRGHLPEAALKQAEETVQEAEKLLIKIEESVQETD
ncbi:ParB/RepB/Spo0J family partition protein [Patescibacteria group bacterium]